MTESVTSFAVSSEAATVSAFRGFQTVGQLAGQMGGLGTAANMNAIGSALPQVSQVVKGIAAAAAGITLMTSSTQARAATSGSSQGATTTPATGALIAQHTSGLYLVRALASVRGDTFNPPPAKGKLIDLREHASLPAQPGRPEPSGRMQTRYLGKVVIS
jgi:hypothetical protein